MQQDSTDRNLLNTNEVLDRSRILCASGLCKLAFPLYLANETETIAEVGDSGGRNSKLNSVENRLAMCKKE